MRYTNLLTYLLTSLLATKREKIYKEGD